MYEDQSIEDFCEENGITQKKLGDLFGVSRQTIRNWRVLPDQFFVRHNKESGLVELIRSEKVFKSCKVEIVTSREVIETQTLEAVK